MNLQLTLKVDHITYIPCAKYQVYSYNGSQATVILRFGGPVGWRALIHEGGER